MAEREGPAVEGTGAPDLDGRMRRTVAVVALVNLAGAIGEGIMAQVSGSVSLWADAADFLEDFLINGLVVVALSWSLVARRRASVALAGLILIPALVALVTAVLKVAGGAPPKVPEMSATAVAAMAVNLLCAGLLLGMRGRGGSLVRGAWLAARNDVLGNLLILAAGVLTLWWVSIWPDVIVGVAMCLVNLGAAKEVYEQARSEHPELETEA